MGKLFKVFNGAMPTTAAPVAVTTGTAIKTMLQLKPAVDIKIVAWGVSMDQSAVATPGKWEAITTGTVGGTVTAYGATDVMPFDDPNALANTAGTSGVPLNLGTTHSGFTCTSEGSITSVRIGDVQYIDPLRRLRVKLLDVINI